MEEVLVIVPDDNVREALRVRLGPCALRARTYEQGMVLAEQERPTSIILWTPPGADSAAIQTYAKLRRLLPRARLVVITPEIIPAGLAVYDYLHPKAYLPERSTATIVAAALGIGTPPVNTPPPTSSGRGSSGFPM